jgi:hypothetical protein
MGPGVEKAATPVQQPANKKAAIAPRLRRDCRVAIVASLMVVLVRLLLQVVVVEVFMVVLLYATNGMEWNKKAFCCVCTPLTSIVQQCDKSSSVSMFGCLKRLKQLVVV